MKNSVTLFRPFLHVSPLYKLNFFPCIGDDDEDEEEEGDGEEKMPTCGDYIMHFLTLPWKVIFAVIPPAGETVFQLSTKQKR